VNDGPGPDPRTAIDDVIARFFAVFDNRPGRSPDAQIFCSLFAPNAVIATHIGREVLISTPMDFVNPRVELLDSGRLVNFSEWETHAETRVLGTLAVRRSKYEKAGQLDGRPYAGTGTKFFQLASIGETWRIVSLSWIDDGAPDS
jgi:hypothetical protein